MTEQPETHKTAACSRRAETSRTPKTVLALLFLLSACGGDSPAAHAQMQSAPGDAVLTILPGDKRLKTPDFNPYEVEYESAFGRFHHQVRKFKGAGGDKISVLNILVVQQGVIVDHRTIDAKSLRIESFASPYFAWGEEFVFLRADADGYDLVRIPIGGGEPIYTAGALANNGYFDGLGFSPTLAALLPLEVGTKFHMPKDRPRKDGRVESVLTTYEVTGTERLDLSSGVGCDCWVIEETDIDGSINKYWVSMEAPFLIQRHRDVGGRRSFISSVIRFKRL